MTPEQLLETLKLHARSQCVSLTAAEVGVWADVVEQMVIEAAQRETTIQLLAKPKPKRKAKR